MASLPYPRRPPNSFHRTHSKFVCASPPTEFTEFTEISGGGYSPTDFTEYTEASGVEEPPTDAHRWLGCVGFSHGIHRIHSKLGCVRGALGTAWVRQDAIPSYKTSALICAICRRLFSARRFCAFRAICGRTPFALLVQQRLLHPLSLHLWEAIS